MIGRQNLWLLAGALIIPLLISLFAILQPVTEPRLLFMDPSIAGRFPGQCCQPYHGAISMLGVMAWAGTAAVCLFLWSIMLGKTARSDVRRFYLSAGLLSALLALDDGLLLHEEIFPRLGVPELVTFAVYGGAGLVHIALNWRVILQHQWLIFCVAVTALAFSIGVDVIISSIANHIVLLEDIAKLVGISCWAVFHIEAAIRSARTKPI